MDAEGVTHRGVETFLHRDEAQGLYHFGVIVNGEAISLLHHKLGRIDKHVKRGQEREAEQQQQQRTTTPQGTTEQ